MLSAGDQLGPYVIVEPLGAGGMGEVYRAKDTRLQRTVALKVLSHALVGREDMRQRFEREARAVSQLNHPNICALHDIGQQNGIDYLVMECLDGETLEARVKRGPLPLSDVLNYGIQIANALDCAHRSGIVHRDLKPGNVMLTKHGVRLLDFGLAKLQIVAAPSEQTLANTLTSESTFLGTLAYMAPEQVEAKEVDARTDIFALGSTIYEMLTARRAFTGNSQAGLIAAIMNAEPPPFEVTGVTVPTALNHVVRTCLAKRPEDRWQSARDIALELKFIAGSLPQSPTYRSQGALKLWPYVIGVIICVLFALIIWLNRQRAQNTALVQLEIGAPDNSEFSGSGSAISPDGRYVAFVATTEGKQRLWLRALEARTARPLDNTDDALLPFWAPDSKSIGFFARDSLKRYELNGGGSSTVAHSTYGCGGTWNRDGMIVYAPTLSSRLWKVPASGGEPAPATVLDSARGDVRHDFPQFLPDGRHFLFLAYGSDPGRSGPYIGSLDDPIKTEPIPQLTGNPFQAVYAPGDSSHDYLIYVRERSLVAQPFNIRSLRLEGQPEPFISRELISVAPFPGFLNVTASTTGTVLDGGTQRARNELVWRKRDGTFIEVVGEESDYVTPQVSPDASRIAVTKADPSSGGYDMWIEDWRRKLFSRFTFQRGMNAYPVWAPDGRSIIYTSDSAGRRTLFRKDVAGSGASEQLLKNSEGNEYGFDMSPDGAVLLFTRTTGTDRGDIWTLRLNGSGVASSFLKTPAGEFDPQFSPGPQRGRWVVYSSDESGIDQIYVRRFTGGAAEEARWQISSNGGRYPRWRGDGGDIVYLGPDGVLMSAAIRFGADSIEAGRPTPLFAAALPSTPFIRYPYDISPDGKKFLVLNAARGRAPGNLTLLLNWTGLLTH